MPGTAFESLLRGKRAVSITAKGADYIRTRQVNGIVAREAGGTVFITAERKNFPGRVAELRRKIRMHEDAITSCEVLVLGFLPQLILPLLKRPLAKRSGRPVIVSDLFLSLYDTVALDRGLVRRDGRIAGQLLKRDRTVIAASDLILTDTAADARFFRACCGFSDGAYDGRFETLDLEADKAIWVPAGVQTGGVRTGGENVFRVLWFGTGLPLQGIDVILDALALAACGLPEGAITFTLVGGLNRTQRKRLQRIPAARHISWLTQEALRDAIAAADLCLAGHFHAGDGKEDRTVPGKAVIYEAMAKDMILGDSTANRERFSEDDRHHFAARGDAEALARAITEQFAAWREGKGGR